MKLSLPAQQKPNEFSVPLTNPPYGEHRLAESLFKEQTLCDFPLLLSSPEREALSGNGEMLKLLG